MAPAQHSPRLLVHGGGSGAALHPGSGTDSPGLSRSPVCVQDGPGAREADTIGFLERALQHPYLAHLRPEFLAGADRLDAVARDEWEAPYVELPFDDQDRVLAFIAEGGADDDSFEGGAFVHELIILTLEGFLGDPVHGANKDQVGWDYIGYAPDGPLPGECGH